LLFEKLIKYRAFLVLLLGVGFIFVLVMMVVNVNKFAADFLLLLGVPRHSRRRGAAEVLSS